MVSYLIILVTIPLLDTIAKIDIDTVYKSEDQSKLRKSKLSMLVYCTYTFKMHSHTLAQNKILIVAYADPPLHFCTCMPVQC